MSGTPTVTRPGVILIGNFPPPFGGVPRHLSEFAPFLASRGWQVHVLSPGLGTSEAHDGFTVTRDDRGSIGRWAAALPLPTRSLRAGSMASVFSWRRDMPARIWLRALSIMRLALRYVDRQHIHLVAGYGLLNGAPPAALLSDVLGVPLVVTVFGEIHSHRAAVLRQHPFVVRMARRARLTSITRHCADSLATIGVEGNVTVLPYGIDVARFHGGGGASFRQRLGIPAQSVVAAFVGRLIPDMGLNTLLDAIPSIHAELPDIFIVIAGTTGSLRPVAEGLARRSAGRVHVLADVPEVELPGVVASADLLMCPTAGARACGSLAAIEAMASGKPVVAARVGGIPEVVTDDCAVLVEPGNPAMLAHAVIELARDPSRRQQMGERGRERAQRAFDRDRTNAAIEAFFRAAITHDR